MVFLSRTPRSASLGERYAEVRTVRSGPRFTVYYATELATGRPVAVKTPTERGQAWLVEQLTHEHEVLTRVGPHANVVGLYGRTTLPDGRPALLLQQSSGTLEDRVHGADRMPLPDVAALGVALAGALERVHDAGWVHGNVRPRTVLRGPDDTPMLAGFDEAVPVDAAATAWPLHVTTAHTAPEVLEGGVPTRASDVYGLASTIYELVAGRAAFHAYVGESPAAVIVRVLSTPVQPIIAPGVPLELSDLLTWALSADPARRPPSPAWLAEELRRLQSRQGWRPTAPSAA